MYRQDAALRGMSGRDSRGDREGTELRVRELDDTRGDRQRGRIAHPVDETARRPALEGEDRHARRRVRGAGRERQQGQMQIQS